MKRQQTPEARRRNSIGSEHGIMLDSKYFQRESPRFPSLENTLCVDITAGIDRQKEKEKQGNDEKGLGLSRAQQLFRERLNKKRKSTAFTACLEGEQMQSFKESCDLQAEVRLDHTKYSSHINLPKVVESWINNPPSIFHKPIPPTKLTALSRSETRQSLLFNPITITNLNPNDLEIKTRNVAESPSPPKKQKSPDRPKAEKTKKVPEKGRFEGIDGRHSDLIMLLHEKLAKPLERSKSVGKLQQPDIRKRYELKFKDVKRIQEKASDAKLKKAAIPKPSRKLIVVDEVESSAQPDKISKPKEVQEDEVISIPIQRYSLEVPNRHAATTKHANSFSSLSQDFSESFQLPTLKKRKSNRQLKNLLSSKTTLEEILSSLMPDKEPQKGKTHEALAFAEKCKSLVLEGIPSHLFPSSVDSLVIDQIAHCPIQFPSNQTQLLKTLELLLEANLDQLRKHSGSHADLAEQIFQKLKDAAEEREFLLRRATGNVLAEVTKVLSAVVEDYKRLRDEYDRVCGERDKERKEKESMKEHSEMAFQQFQKAQQAKQSSDSTLSELRTLLLTWLPNFQKYSLCSIQSRKLTPILPDYTNITQLGGIDFWTTQQLRLEYDNARAMWGLDIDELDQIEYRGQKISKLSAEELWLRSDLCRLQKLIGVPTTEAVEVEQLRYTLKSKNQYLEHQTEQVGLLSDRVKELLEDRSQLQQRLTQIQSQQKATPIKKFYKSQSTQTFLRQDIMMFYESARVIDFVTNPADSNCKDRIVMLMGPGLQQIKAVADKLKKQKSRSLSKRRQKSRVSVEDGNLNILSLPLKPVEPDRLPIQEQKNELELPTALGTLNVDTGLYQTKVRFSQTQWWGFKQTYELLQRIMVQLKESENGQEKTGLEQLREAAGMQFEKILTDLFVLREHDWRVTVFCDMMGLRFNAPQLILSEKFPISVKAYEKDLYRIQLVQMVLNKAKVNVKKTFGFGQQNNLATELTVGRVPEESNWAHQLTLQDAFITIADGLLRKLLTNPTTFEEFGSDLLWSVFSELRSKAASVELGELGDTTAQRVSILRNLVFFNLKVPEQEESCQRTLKELQFLEAIISIMTIDTPTDIFKLTPLKADLFRKYLRKRIQIPSHLDKPSEFTHFCNHYITLEPGQVRNDSTKTLDAWISNRAISNLRNYHITFRVDYQDVLLIGSWAQTLLGQVMKDRLQPVFNQHMKPIPVELQRSIAAFKANDPTLSIDGFKQALLMCAGVQDKVRPEIRKVEVINVGRQMAKDPMDMSGAVVSKAKLNQPIEKRLSSPMLSTQPQAHLVTEEELACARIDEFMKRVQAERPKLDLDFFARAVDHLQLKKAYQIALQLANPKWKADPLEKSAKTSICNHLRQVVRNLREQADPDEIDWPQTKQFLKLQMLFEARQFQQIKSKVGHVSERSENSSYGESDLDLELLGDDIRPFSPVSQVTINISSPEKRLATPAITSQIVHQQQNPAYLTFHGPMEKFESQSCSHASHSSYDLSNHILNPTLSKERVTAAQLRSLFYIYNRQLVVKQLHREYLQHSVKRRQRKHRLLSDKLHRVRMAKANRLRFQDLTLEQFAIKFKEQFAGLSDQGKLRLPTMEELKAREYAEDSEPFTIVNSLQMFADPKKKPIQRAVTIDPKYTVSSDNESLLCSDDQEAEMVTQLKQLAKGTVKKIQEKPKRKQIKAKLFEEGNLIDAPAKKLPPRVASPAKIRHIQAVVPLVPISYS